MRPSTRRIRRQLDRLSETEDRRGLTWPERMRRRMLSAELRHRDRMRRFWLALAAVAIAATAQVADARVMAERTDRTVAIVYGCEAEDSCHADYRRDGSWRIIRNGPHR